ncbi:MAG: serine hydrolase domain-containing protein [Casimicrobiaceae bacterium]
MKRHLAFLAAAAAMLLLSSCYGDDVTPAATRYRTAVQRVMAQYHVPGALISVRVPEEAAFRESFGVANLTTREPIALDSHFSIRSITKSFTVTALLQLVRDGVLTLDDKLDQYFPGFPIGDHITLADLAGMQSGIGEYTANPDFQKLFFADLGRPFTAAALAGYGLAESPRFFPGARYEYVNTNTVLVGMIVEQVTGKPLGTVLQEQIFTPLGLVGTSYPSTVPLPDPHPTPYEVNIHTGVSEQPVLVNPTSLAGAGAMVSTLADLETWAQELGTGRLIGPALQRQRIDRSRAVTNGPEYGRYGLGIGILKGWLGHTGTAIGWQAATFYDPRTGATISVLVNATPEGGRRDLNFAQELFEALVDVVESR